MAMSTIVATVGVDGSTTLAAGGAGVLASLRHGTYILVIHDRSRGCGFRLYSSTGVVTSTGTRFAGNARRRVTLVRGMYTYSCGGRHRHTLRVT